MMTLLQLVQTAMGELGLTQPTLVGASADLGVVQFRSLLNSLGRELAREHEWEALSTEYRFTTQFLTTTGTLTSGSAIITGIPTTAGLGTTYMVVGTGAQQDCYVQSVDSSSQVTMSQAATVSGVQTINFCKTKYSFPPDYDRPVNRTQWDKSKHWEMQGPKTAQEWQWLKSGYISVAPQIRFRPIGGMLNIWPPISTAEFLGLEYISANWVTDAIGAGKSSFTADTDVCIFPDDVMILGVKDRYTQAKGFARQYQPAFMSAKSIAMAADAGATTLNMGSKKANQLIGYDNIPPTGYGA